MNEQFYNVSANPHVRDKASTHSIMLDVIIALLPATLFGFWNFGVKAIINTVICVAVCVLAEYVWQRCMHQKVTVKDFSAALTGLKSIYSFGNQRFYSCLKFRNICNRGLFISDLIIITVFLCCCNC